MRKKSFSNNEDQKRSSSNSRPNSSTSGRTSRFNNDKDSKSFKSKPESNSYRGKPSTGGFKSNEGGFAKFKKDAAGGAFDRPKRTEFDSSQREGYQKPAEDRKPRFDSKPNNSYSRGDKPSYDKNREPGGFGAEGRGFGRKNSSDNQRTSYGERKPYDNTRKERQGDFQSRPPRTFDRNNDEASDKRPRARRGEADLNDAPVYRERKRKFQELAEKKEFKPREQRSFGDKPKYEDRGEFKPREQRSFGDKPKYENRGEFKPREQRSFGDKPKYEDRGEFKPREQRSFGDKPKYEDRGEFKPREQRSFGDKPKYEDRGEFKPKERKLFGEKQNFDDKSKRFSEKRFNKSDFDAKPENTDDREPRKRRFDGPYQPNLNNDTGGKRDKKRLGYRSDERSFEWEERAKETIEEKQGTIRLNRFIANSGICSRRDADELIQAGQITVNGQVIEEMGYQVQPTDSVKYGNKLLTREKMVYVLLNKPKDFITTTEDPRDRRTVMHLVENACKERIYPVGRLDRNTTGLILLTNDGELASKLTHPSYEVEKVYQVELDKPITEEHFQQIKTGITLEDGEIKADEIAIVTPDAMVVGVKIHSGRNHIVRRIFAHLGYDVLKLDRTSFAGLNKKDLPRGNYRLLTEKEIIKLKYLS